MDLDSGLEWTLDRTGLWTGLMDYGLNSALEHCPSIDALVIALIQWKSWIFSINSIQWCHHEGHLHHEIIKNSVSGRRRNVCLFY